MLGRERVAAAVSHHLRVYCGRRSPTATLTLLFGLLAALLVPAVPVISASNADAHPASVAAGASAVPQISTATLQGSDPSLPATWKVDYARVTFLPDPAIAAGISAKLKTLAQSLVDDLVAAARARPCPNPVGANPDELTSKVTATVEVTRADPQIVAVVEHEYDYLACTAHGSPSSVAAEFDVSTGSAINPAALFRPGSGELALAGAAVDQLQRTPPCNRSPLILPPDANEVRDALTTAGGTAIALTSDGLMIIFNFGPSCAADSSDQPTVVLPYGSLGEILDPRYLPGPAAVDQPSDPCTRASVVVKLHGDVAALSAFAGGDGSLEADYLSDQTPTPPTTTAGHASFNVQAEGKFRLGLQGVFGEEVQLGAAGQTAGLSDSVTVAGGLEVGAGATLSVHGVDHFDTLSAAFRTGADPSGANATVSELFVEMGVWLSGDIGVTGAGGGASGNLDVEGVIGAKLNFVDNQLEFSTYYFALRGTLGGSFTLPAGTTLPGGLPSPTGGLDFELVLGMTADLEDHPLKGSIEVTAAVNGGFDLGKEVKDPTNLLKHVNAASANISGATGREIKFAVDLDLVDPANFAPWNAVLIGSDTPADEAALNERLAHHAEMTIVEYAVKTTSGAAKVKFGDGVSFGLGLNAETESKTAIGAAFVPPGGIPQPWTSCVGTVGP